MFSWTIYGHAIYTGLEFKPDKARLKENTGLENKPNKTRLKNIQREPENSELVRRLLDSI